MGAVKVVVTNDHAEVIREAIVKDDWFLVCNGRSYVSSEVRHANGTVQLTIKLRPEEED